MARPIEATPTLYGEDAERLLKQLEVRASPEELVRRRELAKERLKYMSKPKKPLGSTKPEEAPVPRTLEEFYRWEFAVWVGISDQDILKGLDESPVRPSSIAINSFPPCMTPTENETLVLFGIKIVADPAIPRGVVELRSWDGEVMVRM